jgi:hypothetical protein
VKWSLQLLPFGGDAADRITVFDALEKQLGLKLEQRQIPTPVLMVDKANRTPNANPLGVAEALPAPPAPKEFEVADVKPTAPDARPGGRFQMQPGGRFISQGMPMRFLVGRAFPGYSNDQLIGLRGWVDSDRFDITALVPADAQQLRPILDAEQLAPMVHAAGGPLQDDVSHRRADVVGVFVGCRETQNEEGRTRRAGSGAGTCPSHRRGPVR